MRFYLVDGDRRQLQRIQNIFNLIYEVRKEEGDFSHDDQTMLRMLWPHVNRMHLLQSNLEVLKVSEEVFQRWLEQWEHVPERFIERRTRLPYTNSVPTAELRFELECKGETSKLAALVRGPDGRDVPYFDIKRCNGPHGDEVYVNGRMMRLELPISKEVLNQVFGHQNPTVPTNALAKNLPVLLENRLDLLSGPSVRHTVRKGKPEIRLKADGADVLISARIGNIDILSPSAPKPCGLQRKGGRFLVVEARSKAWIALRGFLGKLKLKPDRSPWFRLPGEAQNMGALDRAVRELPPTIHLNMDGEIQQLFFGQADLMPQLSLREGDGWVDVDVSARVGEVELNNNDLDRILHRGEEFVRSRRGQWLRIPSHALHEFFRNLRRDGIDYGRHRKTRVEAQALVKGITQFPDLRIPKSSEALAGELRELPDVESVPLSDSLAKILRPYQHEGAEFLYNRSGYGVGCVLADDMGLGKTIQTLAFVDALKSNRTPDGKFMVVCPASVVAVWINEGKRFTPDLRIVPLTGSPEQRKEIIEAPETWDMLVTNYAIVRNDFDRLQPLKFDTVILDEAQQIKNPEAQITRCIKALQTRQRVALTGTPLENRPLDLWSIVDFLNPGYLGDDDDFKRRYTETRQARELLSKKLSPLMLRRTKTAVAPELPPRIEENLFLPLADSQQMVYDEQLAEARISAQEGGFMQILAALTKLRQTCCHPALSRPEDEDTSHLHSSKMDCLLDMLDELLQEGHSALVFSQFVSMLDLLEEEMKKRRIDYHKIVGATPTAKRMEIVDSFNNSAKPSVFLLSLRAAGTGLTLTKADYVFIYDPWWNPAVENQAIDRTHRIGQDKRVIAYRLIAEGTVEEKVIAMQDEKRQLFEELVEGTQSMPAGLKAEDLISLLA